jgi:hypothetical protein
MPYRRGLLPANLLNDEDDDPINRINMYEYELGLYQ